MGRIVRSPQAEIDLWEIVDLIAARNLGAAVKLLEEVDRALERLSPFPGLGPARDELAPGLRSYPLRPYLLFYRLIDDGVQLVRVIDGRRDLENALGS